MILDSFNVILKHLIIFYYPPPRFARRRGWGAMSSVSWAQYSSSGWWFMVLSLKNCLLGGWTWIYSPPTGQTGSSAPPPLRLFKTYWKSIFRAFGCFWEYQERPRRSKTPQEASNTSQEPSKTAQDGPRWPLDGPRAVQEQILVDFWGQNPSKLAPGTHPRAILC